MLEYVEFELTFEMHNTLQMYTATLKCLPYKQVLCSDPHLNTGALPGPYQGPATK